MAVVNNTYLDELAAERAVNQSLLREIFRLTHPLKGYINMSRKVVVFEHEGELYATTNYEPVDETKMADFVTDITTSLEQATSALEQYRALAATLPPKEVPAEPTVEAPEAVTEPEAVTTAPAEVATTEAPQEASATIEQSTPAPEAVTDAPVLCGEPAPVETPPAEATSVESIHLQ